MELGQKIMISKKYRSLHTVLKKGKHADYYGKKWNIVDIPKCEAVFVGYRILKEGYFYWETNNPINHIKVALMAINLRGCIYVPLNCL